MGKTDTRSKTFRATPERAGDSLNWVVMRLPFDGAARFGRRGQIRVRGTINGFAYRTTLFPDGKGGHMMVVNKQMQKCGNAVPGKPASFVMELDTEERTVAMPVELKRALAEDRSLVRFYDSLSLSNRKEIARFVGESKNAQTRAKRADEMAERMMLVMEGMSEVPPVLRAAIAGNPRAQAGWEKMPPSHKRGHLFGIYGYKKPESRARRIAKAVAMMEEYGAKAERKRRVE